MFARRRPTSEQTQQQYEGYGRREPPSEITTRRYEELLERLEPYRQLNRILDVGCGEGEFLQVAARRGWEVHGTESTESAVARNRDRGIAMTLAPVQPGQLPSGAFDVVTAFEVVEHLADPGVEGRVIADVTREHGALYVTTPNFNAASRHVLGARWSVIEYPEHLSYFTVPTLDRWLTSVGFARVHMTTTGFSPERLTDSLGRRSSRRGATHRRPLPAPDDERLRTVIERSSSLRLAKRVINTGLGSIGAGDTIKALFVRSSQRQC